MKQNAESFLSGLFITVRDLIRYVSNIHESDEPSVEKVVNFETQIFLFQDKRLRWTIFRIALKISTDDPHRCPYVPVL